MHARVTTISGSPDQVEQGIASFRDDTLPAITEAGGQGGRLLIDRESGGRFGNHALGGRGGDASERGACERATPSGVRAAGCGRATERPSIRGGGIRELLIPPARRSCGRYR